MSLLPDTPDLRLSTLLFAILLYIILAWTLPPNNDDNNNDTRMS